MSMSDKNTSDQAAQELAAQLKDKPVDQARADAIAQEEEEDIDAFLATLEDDTQAPAGDAQLAAAPADDPFAAAFADLEAAHPDDEPEPAPAPVTAPAPAPSKAKDEPKAKPAAVIAAAPPEPSAAAKPTKAPEEAPAKKPEAPKKTGSAPAVPVVEKVRSPGFRFTMWALKTAFFFTPVLLLWWLLGAYTSGFFERGWISAIIATALAFIVPALPRFMLGKGKYAWWAFAISVLGLAALLGPMPGRSGSMISAYGHWPVSTVSQLAGWDADHIGVTVSAGAAGLVGQRLEALVPLNHRQPMILGTEQTIDQWSVAHKAELEKAAKEAKEAKEAKPQEKSNTPEAPSKEPTPTPEAPKQPAP